MIALRSLRGLVAVTLAVGLTGGCAKPPPTTVAGWAKRIPQLEKPKEIKHAADQLRRLATAQLRAGKSLKSDVPVLIPLLKQDPVVRGPAAYLLGRIGDPSAVEPLINAIDYSAAVADKEASRANGQIAEALGHIGDKRAMKSLLKLTRSRDQYTALAAVEALGHAGGKEAIKPLTDLIENPGVDNFIVKHAIEALGNIGDPSALPVLIKALFIERRGVSFYREASFAVFQMGDTAAPLLIKILDGRDKDLMAWAKDKSIYPAAIYAKTAQVLGDLSDRRATGALMKRLGYESDDAQLELTVRMMAAESLGRIHALKARHAIEDLLKAEDVTARQTYSRALVLLGDPASAPALAHASMTGQGYPPREGAQEALARLGGASDLARFDAATKLNNKLSTCTNWFEGDKKAIAANCKKLIKKYDDDVTRFRPMLVAAKDCKRDGACWAKKLSDKNGRVREKAAWALAHLRDAKAIDPLLKAVKEDDLEARFAMIQALDELLFGDNDKKPSAAVAQKVSDRLRAILKAEAHKMQFMKINEDLKRLALKAEKTLAKDKAADGTKTAAK